jgi:5'-deoxynucleotidase YfbR-like HD superfamily hydrolase
MCASIPRVDAFTVVFGGLLLFFVVTVLLLGLFSKRSARDYLDWKPTRSPEVEAQNEIDDVEQMIQAQNEMKRRRGAPEITEEEIEARVRADRDELKRWRES